MSSCFEPGAAILVENGRFFARGVVLGEPDNPRPPYPEPRIKVEIFRNKIDVPIEQVRLAPMSAERPWEEHDRKALEDALAMMAAQIAGLQAEAQGMAEVIAMQMEAISAPAEPKHPILSHGHVRYYDDKFGNLQTDNGEWYEHLLDYLEMYLVRTVGERRPVRIADPDLRALVSHILE